MSGFMRIPVRTPEQDRQLAKEARARRTSSSASSTSTHSTNTSTSTASTQTPQPDTHTHNTQTPPPNTDTNTGGSTNTSANTSTSTATRTEELKPLGKLSKLKRLKLKALNFFRPSTRAISCNDLRTSASSYYPMERFYLGMIRKPKQTLHGINAAFSYFHKIPKQIDYVFNKNWEPCAAPTFGASNTPNIIDFGREAVSTAQFARSQLFQNVNSAAGRGRTYTASIPKLPIKRNICPEDIRIKLISYPPRTSRSIGESAILIEFSDERIPICFRPTIEEGGHRSFIKAKPSTGGPKPIRGGKRINQLRSKLSKPADQPVEGQWTEAPDLLMKNNIKETSLNLDPQQTLDLIHTLKQACESRDGSAPTLDHLLENLMPHSLTPSATANDLSNFHAKNYNSTHAVFDMLTKASLPIEETLITESPAKLWTKLDAPCATLSGLVQFQNPTRKDVMRMTKRILKMKTPSDFADMASDLTDAMLQYKDSLKEFNDVICSKRVVPDGISAIKTLADDFSRLDTQLSSIIFDGMNRATCQNVRSADGSTGLITEGERILPRPQDIATKEKAKIRVKIVTHPPRSKTSMGQTALAFEVNSKLVHAVGFKRLNGKSRRWSFLRKRGITLNHMRPLLRKQNLKSLDLELSEEQIQQLLITLNQYRADLKDDPTPFLPQLGHLKTPERFTPRNIDDGFGRKHGNDIDHIIKVLELTNMSLTDNKIEIPELLKKHASHSRHYTQETTNTLKKASRFFTKKVSKHIPNDVYKHRANERLYKELPQAETSLYNRHFPEHLTGKQRLKLMANVGETLDQVELIANSVLIDLDSCLQLTEKLMVKNIDPIASQLKAMSSTPLKRAHPNSDDGKPDDSTWSGYTYNRLSDLVSGTRDTLSSTLSTIKEATQDPLNVLNSIAHLPKTIVDTSTAAASTAFSAALEGMTDPKETLKAALDTGSATAGAILSPAIEGVTFPKKAFNTATMALADIEALDKSLDQISRISGDLWRPMVEKTPKEQKMLNKIKARNRIDAYLRRSPTPPSQATS